MIGPAQTSRRYSKTQAGLACLAFLAWTLSPAGASAAEDEVKPRPSPFLRFVPTKPSEGRVDTAIKTYGRPDGVSVTLVAAVHVADADYYQKLQTRLKSFEAVLYEMVKPKDTTLTPGARTDSPVSALQIGIKNMLALEFQLDAIDYSPTNFVHADMDVATFQRQQEAKGESILGLMIRAVLEEQSRIANSPNPPDGLQLLFALMSKDSAYKLKFLFAQQLENIESIFSGLDQGSDGEGSVLLSGRNQVAMDVLAAQIEKGKRNLAIFYGAGHMPDFEKRLLKSGYKKTSEQWLTAWDIRPQKSSK